MIMSDRMRQPEARRQFAEMVAGPDESVDLAQAALLIACEEYPELDVDGYLRRMEDLAAAVALRALGAGPEGRRRALHEVLFDEEGFHGNAEDYYDPRNSFLNDVLDRKTGIPITLSTVYIEVGRRAGIAVAGVGLPGHFVVRAEGALVDPFHGGAVLSEEDCQRRLDRIYGGRLRLDDAMLAACDRKAILGRTLRNLKAIHTKSGDFARALSAVELLIGLEPQALEERRDRGLLHAAMDCYALAAGELEDYLDRAGNAPGAAQVRQKIAELRASAARVN
jgi:regulator of sirC expression with transglutaminase-like and TPR domain